MTIKEFNDEFDIHYNNIAGQSNPDLDVFEKSVYLTKAQLEIIKNYYDAISNRKQKGFEATEKRRRDLGEIVKSYSSTLTVPTNIGLNLNSKFIPIPNDTFLIVLEKLNIISEDCDNGKSVDVEPVTHDEYNVQIKNPFQLPDKDTAWRIDISKLGNQKVVEIITTHSNFKYQMRYIKYPKPIILADLSTTYPSETLSIDGQVTPSTCELNESIHREILDRAIEIALNDYKPEKVPGKVQLDARNE